MPFHPQWKCCFRCEVIPPEGVILFSERGHFLLRGTVYFLLAPLLNGQYTDDEIVESLRGQVSPAKIFYALHLLRRNGYVGDAAPSIPAAQGAFWDLLDVVPQEAVQRLGDTIVSIVSFGAIDPAPFQAMLVALGIRIGDEGKLRIALADDYLHPGLDACNQEALTHDRPWLLIKPVGTEVWIGPLFVPQKTGCWACLAHRLQGRRKVETYVQEKKNILTPLVFPPATLPSTLQTAYSLAATETAKWIVRAQNEEIEGRVITFDTLSLAKHSHQVVRRPQCPRCGTPAAFTAQQGAPPVLQLNKKILTPDGEHRPLTPEETLEKLKHHISPLTGIVNVLQPHTLELSEHSSTSCYIAGHNFVQVSRDDSFDFDFLYNSLRGASGGKGQNATQAKVSALCEAIERYSGIFQGDEARLRACYHHLGARAIHPNACMLFSERQVENRQQWNARSSSSQWVPEQFDENKEIEWSPVWSLTYKEWCYLPTAYCFYGYSRKHDAWFARADSNGCAAGHSKEEAILHGFLELVERDSVAVWWYNRLKKPSIDLPSFFEPYVQELQAHYWALHRDFWVLDITSDLNIPTFAAISRRIDKEVEEIIFGFGTHFDPRIAILRALTELNQSLSAVRPVSNDQEERYVDHDPAAIAWWKTAILKNHPYLAPDAAATLKRQANYCQRWSDDFSVDLLTCVKLVEKKGLEILVLDQTRPDTGLDVVKVIVPGLRHFWARFAPGRLYEVPVQMGWLAESLTEDQLNPHHIYF